MRNVHLVLVPIAYNDGTDVPEEIFHRYINELSIKFGGATFLPPAFGGWIDNEGRFQPEKHRPLVVSLPDGEKEELIEWVRQAGRELGQVEMLVMHNFCEASFIEIQPF